LNDNCDGTFTVKSFYQDKSAGIGKGGKILSKAPSIVVSREPLASNSPIPKAQLPPYLAARPSLGVQDEPEPRVTRNRIPRVRNRDLRELWAYIQQHLVSVRNMPENPAIRHLLSLPRQRDVKYNTQRRRTDFVETGSRDIAAMIIQVTGDEVSDVCKRCRQGKGPFEGCVVVPHAAHEDTKERYPCCGNCLYGGKKLHCTLRQWIQQRDSWSNWAAGEDEPFPGAGNLSRQTENLYGAPPTRRDVVKTQRSTARPSFPAAAPSRQPVPSALISQGTFQSPNDLLEMEDWEVAPGRIRETAATEPESKSLTTPLCPPN
jgi:hypothetical protein